ncbi:hypothetical protein BT96DRAFT_547364 [Gymnopus androsaceus JB14]|uniref:Uncharacterized protein n=1 Tax=Gymnopus androsaceus JB14 TaxID=1447944 RepID=A0A6A4HTG3_9AGAR|nr:hypothetical protein BT96DRAFT_547364 [Gymnopus androsaceus JB14]
MSASNSSSRFLLTNLSNNLNLGNGLIDLSALTTLIGSTAAESLVLGNRGPAGVSWSAMSAFGTLSIIRACIGAAVSGWMRETLGLRTKSCDLAVGMHLGLDDARKVRDGLGSPLAIMCEHSEQSDVYAFDQATLSLLEGVTETPPESPLVVHTYAQFSQHDFFTPSNYRVKMTLIMLSLAKIAEIQVLWTRGSPALAITTALPWSFFFLVGVAVLIAGRYSSDDIGPIDLLMGQLPSIKRTGGHRVVVLGVHRNPRRSVWWRVAWSIGALVCTGSILFTYAILSSQPSVVVILWAGFQIFWLVARIIVHYFTAPSDRQRLLVGTALDRLSPELKGRALNLTIALGKYLTLIPSSR